MLYTMVWCLEGMTVWKIRYLPNLLLAKLCCYEGEWYFIDPFWGNSLFTSPVLLSARHMSSNDSLPITGTEAQPAGSHTIPKTIIRPVFLKLDRKKFWLQPKTSLLLPLITLKQCNKTIMLLGYCLSIILILKYLDAHFNRQSLKAALEVGE